jgi:stringent starvation protein B
MQGMTSNQPYLVKAFFDWINDNNLTPYMVIDATVPGTEVPQQFVKDGQIVLNLSPAACVNFHMDLEWISFQARFGGKPMTVRFPLKAVSAIYAKENGAGTVFTNETIGDEPEPPEPPPMPTSKSKKASLRVVK